VSPRLRQVAQDRLGKAIQRAARSRGRHGLRQPLEQLLLELAFQLGDLHAERRLYHVHSPGGASDASLLEQSDKVGDLTQIHRRFQPG